MSADLDYPAIERAAIDAVLDKIAEAVDGMFGQFHPLAAVEVEPTRHDVVSRKAVLRIIEENRP